MAKKDPPSMFACAGCGVVTLPAPGLCPSCKATFGKPKPKPGK